MHRSQIEVLMELDLEARAALASAVHLLYACSRGMHLPTHSHLVIVSPAQPDRHRVNRTKPATFLITHLLP